MSYFSKFPNTIYDITAEGADEQLIVVKDIVRRVKLKDSLVNNVFSYDEYDIKEGERPDILAHQFYGDSNLAWVILLTNEIHDIHQDWPKTERELNATIVAKYDNPDAVMFTERPQESGNAQLYVRCTSGESGSRDITYRQYEQRRNEEKRRIKILRKELLTEFLEQFEEIIRD